MRQTTENKTALITGAGTGLGRAIAITLAQEGYTVVLTGRREEKLREVANEIERGRALVIPADVTDEQSVTELSEKLLEQTRGRLDLLVNNVGGVPAMGPIDKMTLSQWKQVMDINLTSTFLVTKTFLPALRKSNHGKIISITSMAAHTYIEGLGAYSVSKAGVESFMKIIEEEVKEHGIKVHLFDPGSVTSEGNPHGGKDPIEIMGKIIELIK